MFVPTDSRAFWRGTVGTIPADWLRDTDFDDRYLQGADATFTSSTTGGSATHQHTVLGVHVHGAHAIHKHLIRSDSGNGGLAQAFNEAFAVQLSPYEHSHGTVFSTVGETGGTKINHASVTITAAPLHPSNVTMIVIKPDPASAPQAIPNGASCLTDESTTLPGFGIQDGTDGLPDYDGRFIRGADTGANGGDPDGGNLSHESPEHLHTPLAVEHDHPGTVVSGDHGRDSVRGDPEFGDRSVHIPGHHDLTLDNHTNGDTELRAPVINDSDPPEYIELLGIENTSGAARTPIGVVMLSVGDPDALPYGWGLCDGTDGTQDCTDRQVQITTSGGSVGDTGGSNTHANTMDAHGHSGDSHNHPVIESGNGNISVVFAGTTGGSISSHTHTWTTTAASETYTSASLTMDSLDGRYKWRDGVWVKNKHKTMSCGTNHKTPLYAYAA